MSARTNSSVKIPKRSDLPREKGPYWQKKWHSGQYHLIAFKPWVVDEEAAWQYKDGRLYVKDEGNFGMVTLAMLSKPKKRT